MSIKISYKGPASALVKGKGFPFRKISQALEESVEKEANRILNDVRASTPGGRGKARSGWRLVRKSSGRTVTIAIKNPVKYITVLEYGSYPVRALSRASNQNSAIVRGRAYVGGNFKPGPRTQTSSSSDPKMLKPGNVSKKAPKGMVRKTIKARKKAARGKVSKAVANAIKKVFGAK